MRRRGKASWLLGCLLAMVAAEVAAGVGPSACTIRVKERVLNGPVPEDLTELLVAAQLMSVGDVTPYNPNAQGLRDFAERRIWLKALGEPAPHPASVRVAIAERGSVDFDELRKRGAMRILDLRTLAVWSDTEPAPQFATPADNEVPSRPSGAVDATSRSAMLFARFRITNRGEVPVSALSVGFYGLQSPGSSGVERKDCHWRPDAPLRPHESREIACQFEVLRAELPAWRVAIQTPAVPAWIKTGSTVHDVSFSQEGYDIPYIPYNAVALPVDPEIVRSASLRARSACMNEEPFETPLRPWGSALWWILVPGALGTALGWRSAR